MTSIPRPDGRDKFVVYLNPELIREIKMRALDERKHAYEIVEELMTSALRSSEDKGRPR